MNPLSEFVFAGLIPLAAAAAVAFVLMRLRTPAAICCGAGAALGFIVGQFAMASRAGFDRAMRSLVEPREASDWLPHAVLLAFGVTLLLNYTPRSWRPAVVGLAVLLAIGVPARLLAGPVAQQWSAAEKVLHLALLGASVALTWLLLADAKEDELPRVRPVLLVLACVGAAAIIALSGSFTLGRLCGILAAAVSGTALISPRGLEGVAGVVAVSLGSLMILAMYYAKLSPASAALLLLSTIAAAGRLPEVAGGWPAWQQSAFRTALCLSPLVFAVVANLP